MNVERKSISVLRQLTAVVCLFAVLVLWPVRSAQAIGMHNSNVTPATAYTEFAEMFPSVGFMFGYEDGVATDFASGVLIHPNFVLTSGHGVLTNNNSPTSFFDNYLFGLGANSSTQAEEFMFADEVFVNPDYDGVESGVDLALLYFETPFLSAAPAAIYGGQVQVGDVASIVGFGQPGTPNTGTQTPDGVKRAGQNVVESTTAFGDYLFYRFNRQGDTNFLPLGSQGLPGDSGGGWFIQDGDDFLLAGITSGGTGTVGYGFRTSAVQVALAQQWIDQTIQSKAVPEPSSMVLMGAAGVALLRRRKRVAC